MAEGRASEARERAESPATSAGLSGLGPRKEPQGRWRRVTAHLSRPQIAAIAFASYRYERRTELAMPIAGTLLEGGFIGVIADKVYHVHPGVLALITAAPMFGLLSSVLWARLAVGRRKVPLITTLMSLMVACTAVIALIPEGPIGPWILVGSQITARLILGGVITIRSVVWTLNYPREARARVTSRLQILTILTMTVTSLLGGLFLDADPASFRAVYAVGALLAVLGVLAFSRVRLIGETAQLVRERETHHAETGTTPASLASAWYVLRHDPLYARYQACQFLIGVANMMIEAPLIYLVSRELQASYLTSIALTLGIPLGLSMVTLPLWAVYVDRVHISEFRARTSWIWVVAQVFTWVGAVQASLAWIAVGRVILGLSRGGGSLAWQLGHNDFAKPESLGQYMGVHVTLTGLRGAFAPFLGMLLYVGWSPITVPVIGAVIPGFEGIGGHAIGVACVISVLGAYGYWRLHRRITAQSEGQP
jgi:MFS family permease